MTVHDTTRITTDAHRTYVTTFVTRAQRLYSLPVSVAAAGEQESIAVYTTVILFEIGL
jgi:hypothetical protein